MKKLLFPFITSLLFAGSFIAGKYTTADLSPLTTTLLRYLVAMLFLTGLVVRYKWSSLKVERNDLFRLLLLGLFGIVGYHYFFFLSLRHTDVANTAIINALNPIVTGVLAVTLGSERLSTRNYVGISAAFLGVTILIMKGNITQAIRPDLNLGDVFMLFAVLNWAIYSLLVKQLISKYSGFTLTFYATLFGVILLLLLIGSEDPFAQAQSISRTSICAVIYMGVFASGLGYLVYNLSIREIGPTRTASYVFSFVPITVALLALLFFDQPITAVMLASIALILFGLRLVLTQKPSQER